MNNGDLVVAVVVSGLGESYSWLMVITAMVWRGSIHRQETWLLARRSGDCFANCCRLSVSVVCAGPERQVTCI